MKTNHEAGDVNYSLLATSWFQVRRSI